MKTAVYYFSSTGNSLVVARDLAAGLDNARVIPIHKVLPDEDATGYARIGFVFPVYMFGLPLIVAEFLKIVKISPGAYVFCVATCGGLKGRALSLAREILKKRRINLVSGFSVAMPGNYTPLYGAFSEGRQNKMFARQQVRTWQILGSINCQKRGGLMEEAPFLLNLLLYKLVYRYGSAKIPFSAKGFWATQACTKCGLCARVCPVENIQMQDGRPVWLLHCQHCMGCLQWCLVEAIQYGKLTLGKKRYHHPGISAQDIIGKEEL
jgi:NAD-dependent dihydropyrimidine dehydrogenase PreA subunit